MEIIRGMYGLPQAGILSNNFHQKLLSKHGYCQLKQTSGFWQHVRRPISFASVMENFGIGYVGQDHENHMVSALKYIIKKPQQIGKENCTAV